MRGYDEAGLGTLLRRLLAALDGDVQAVYDELDVAFRPKFFPIVRHLLAEGAASVNELAQACGISQPAITQTLGEMRKARLVSTRAGADRRAREIRLTPSGRTLALRLEPVWRAVDEAAASLDRELPEPLRDGVTRALDRLEARPFRERILAAMETA